jgi:hypothetical protein
MLASHYPPAALMFSSYSTDRVSALGAMLTP